MKDVSGLAACTMMLLCCSSAYAWGSLTTAYSNTHGCIDRAAYAVLQGRPGFDAGTFPKQEEVLANEGVSINWSTFGLQGPGPDADGATAYSDHYYNPMLPDQGGAPNAARKWFLKLAFHQEPAKAAAWAAHFVADMTVPYHVNGMTRAALMAVYNGTESSFTPDPRVAGKREWLSNPVTTKREPVLRQIYGGNWPEIVKESAEAATGVHPNEWKVEADRYLAKSNGIATLDWFDPWYWNGPDRGALRYGGSSHLVYEFAVSNCPMVPPRYDELWPGNPVPTWGNSLQVADTVAEYAKRVALWTYDHTDHYIADPDAAVINGASAVLTLWRASFSGLRVSMTQEPDPSPRKPGDPPVVIVHGKLENASAETPQDVEFGLVAMAVGGGKPCARSDPKIVKVGALPPGGPRELGTWHVYVWDAPKCKLQLAAKGHFTKTPDLQVAWRDENITAKLPEATPENAVKPTPPPPVAPPKPVQPTPGDCLAGDQYGPNGQPCAYGGN